jgi:segregation and condensation protein A
MAAMLMEIKSRMLLPRPKPVGQEEVEDPRAELVRRLLEYERMKVAAQKLDRLPHRDRDFVAVDVWVEQTLASRLPQVRPDDLAAAWRGLLQQARMRAHHKVTRDELSVREHMTIVLRLLQEGEFREFRELFEPWKGVPVLVVTFLALLELARESLVEITQAEPYAPIYVKRAGTPAAGEA